MKKIWTENKKCKFFKLKLNFDEGTSKTDISQVIKKNDAEDFSLKIRKTNVWLDFVVIKLYCRPIGVRSLLKTCTSIKPNIPTGLVSKTGV